MDRLLVVSLGAASLGLILLGALAASHELRPVPLADVFRLEGQRACVEAELVHARTTPSGTSRLVLVEGNTSLAAWVPFEPTAVPGDRVRVCGDVRVSGSGVELRAVRADDVRIVRSWRDADVTVDRLAREPWKWRDRRVVLEGDVRCARHECRVDDARTGAGFPVAGPVLPGLQRLEGTVEYDDERTRFRLRVG